MGVKFVNDADLTTVADAIRAKFGTATQLVFPDGMAAAIAAIQVGYTDYTVTGFSAGNGQILLDWISANLPELAVGETRAAVIIGNTSTSNYAMRGFTQHVTDSDRWIINITRSGSCMSITQSSSNPAGTPCYISDGATIRVYDKVVF